VVVQGEHEFGELVGFGSEEESGDDGESRDSPVVRVEFFGELGVDLAGIRRVEEAEAQKVAAS
jgi:hypothetical protein